MTIGCCSAEDKQALRNALAPMAKIHVSSEDSHMVEGVCVGGKRFQALEPDDLPIGSTHGNQEDAARRKVRM